MTSKRLLSFVIAAVLAASGQQRTENLPSGGVPHAKAGGIDLLLPSPEGDFVEVGDRLRTAASESVPDLKNRMLTLYVSSKTRQSLLSGNPVGEPGPYAKVDVILATEYKDFTPEAFGDLCKDFVASLGADIATGSGSVLDQINIKITALLAKSVRIDDLKTLGVLFRKADVLGWAMLGGDGGQPDVTMAGAAAWVRVKGRLITAYVFTPYKSPETIRSLKQTLDTWADRILAANK